MDEKRKGELAIAALKIKIREEGTFRGIADIRRNIGNQVRTPEMVAIKATPEELLELSTSLIEEVFAAQMQTWLS